MHSTMALLSRAACLLARCNAVALPCFACFEYMHSTMALSSRAACLLAQCNAVALPSFAYLECMHSTVAPWSRAACLLARCIAVAVPSSACFECMHSTVAPWSRAVCLLAQCNAFALPKLCMLAQHFGSLEPCCVPAGTVQCICIAKVLHAWNACTALWLPGAVLSACWHGAMQLHCQVLHTLSAWRALWLSRAVLRACWHGAMQLHCRVLHAWNACTAVWPSRAVLCACWHGAMHLHCQSFACLECMHSTMALSSHAACLLARCNAFALPKFCMLGVHAQHWGSLGPCCVPAGTVQCICIAKVLHAWSACT